MKVEKLFSLFLITFFLLFAYSNLAGAVTIKADVPVAPSAFSILSIARSGSFIYAVGIDKDESGYNQVLMYKSEDGGLSFSSFLESTRYVTTSLTNKLFPQVISVDDSGKVFIFYDNSDSTLRYKSFDGTTLSGETTVSCVYPVYPEIKLSNDEDYIYIFGREKISSIQLAFAKIDKITKTEVACVSYYPNRGTISGNYGLVEREDNVLYASSYTSAYQGNIYRSVDNGATWSIEVPSVGGATNSNQYLLIDEENYVYFLYGFPVGTELRLTVRNNESLSWIDYTTSVTDFDTSYTQKINPFFDTNGNFYAFYKDTDGDISVARLNGTNLYSTKVIENGYNNYLVQSRGSWHPDSNLASTTTGLVYAISTGAISVANYNWTFTGIDLTTLGETGEEGGGEQQQGGGACPYYDLTRGWLPTGATCVFADNFEYNGTIRSMGWDVNYINSVMGYDINTTSNYSGYPQIGRITDMPVELNENYTDYRFAMINTNSSSGGKFALRYTLSMSPDEFNAVALIVGYQDNNFYPFPAPVMQIIIGQDNINGTTAQLKFWYNLNGVLTRLTNTSVCDIRIRSSDIFPEVKIVFDMTTQQYTIYARTYVCGEITSTQQPIGSEFWYKIGDSIPFERQANVINRWGWFYLGNNWVSTYDVPVDATQGFGDWLIYKFSGEEEENVPPIIYDVTAQTLNPVCANAIVPVKVSWSDANQDFVSVSGFCDINRGIASFTGWQPANNRYNGFFFCYANTMGIGNFTTRGFAFDNKTSDAFGVSLDSLYPIEVTNNPNCNSEPIGGWANFWNIYNSVYLGTNVTAQNLSFYDDIINNVTIPPYQTSTWGNDMALGLGLNSDNLRFIGALLVIIITIVVLVFMMTQASVEGGILLVVCLIAVVVEIIFFFVIGWLPAWIIFLMALLGSIGFGLTLKNAFGSSTH